MCRLFYVGVQNFKIVILFQLDSYEIRKGKRLKINVSVPNLRLFVGNIPKNKTKEEIQEEFGKRTGNTLVECWVYVCMHVWVLHGMTRAWMFYVKGVVWGEGWGGGGGGEICMLSFVCLHFQVQVVRKMRQKDSKYLLTWNGMSVSSHNS